VDPIGAALTLVLAGSALYRTAVGKHETLTSGLWTATIGMAIGALVVPLDTALKNITGLDSLSQSISYSAMVISSYLIARLTYEVADIESHWPIIFTATSITGMIALYCTTELHHTQTLAIEAVPGVASTWFAIVLTIGILPTHISAIIGVLKIRTKENLLMWLLAVYGGVGALYPILIVTDHIGTFTTRWPMSVLYPLVWVLQFISFGALALAGVISATRGKQTVAGQTLPDAQPCSGT
jgi:hypothetical protein